MAWLVDLVNRCVPGRPKPPLVPKPPTLRRDPDLDPVHRKQHDLINTSGYAAHQIRDSWNEWVKRSWSPDAR